MNFVEVAVLSSKDGVNFNAVEEVPETEERKTVNLINSTRPDGPVKTLREQLRVNKELHEEELKIKNNPFRPPPSMDEDSYQFFLEKEAEQKQKDNERKGQDQRDTNQFKAALLTKKMTTVIKLKEPEPSAGAFSFDGPGPDSEGDDASPKATIQIKTKKKKEKKKKHKKHKRKEKRTESEAKRQKTPGKESVEETEGLASLVGAYADDSE